MTTKAEQYYTDIANAYNLRPPQMFQGAQYAMGEPGLRLPLYMVGNADSNERTQPVTDDFKVALARMSDFVIALAHSKMPDLCVKSNVVLKGSGTAAVHGLTRSIAASASTTTGYLSDFRIETVHPEEIQEGIMSTFCRKSEERATSAISDATVYLLNSARLVQGSKTRRVGSITEVAAQGSVLPDDGGFTELYDKPTCLTIKLSSQSQLLDPALYATPPALRISAAQPH